MHSEPSERRRLPSGEQRGGQSAARCAVRCAVRAGACGRVCQPGVLEVRLPGWAQAGEVKDRRAAKTW